MLDSVYNSTILDYAGNIQHLGRLDNPMASAKAHSKLCGSTIVVDLIANEIDGELQVTEFAHEVRACALGQAAASIMARLVIGSSASELRQLQSTMSKMLRENGPPPAGKYDEFKFLEPVRDYKARHASTMLTFDAVVDCLGQIETANEQ